MIMSLTAPTKEASGLMEELGVSAFDADGNMRPLNDVFADLGTELDKMTQAGRMETLSTLFNARDIKAAEAMLSNYGDRWDELSGYIDDANGAAAKMAETQLDNLAGDVTLFKSALEGAQIAVSDALSPALRDFVQFGTDGMSKLASAFQDGGVSGAMDALGDILSDGIAMVTEKIPDMINAGMQLLSALGQGLIDNAPQIFSALVEVGGMIGNAIMSGLDSLSEAIATFDWAGKAAEIAQFLTEALTGDGASHFMETATSIIGGLAEGLGQALPELIPAAVDIVMSLATSLLDNADKLIDGAIALIEGLAMGLINALPVLVAKAPEIIAKLVMAIAEGAPKLFEAAFRIVEALREGIVNLFPELTKAAIEIVGALQAGIIDFAGRMVEAATRLIEEFKSAIFSFDFAQWGKDMIDSFVSGIKGAVGSIKDAAIGAAEGIRSVLHFSKPDEGPLADFDTYAPDMMAEFANGITNSIGTVLTAVIGMATSIKNGFTPMIEAMTTTASTMMSTFITAIQNTFPQLTELATKVLQLIVDTINNLLSKILTLGSQIVAKFMEGIRSKFGELKNTAAKIIETVKSAIAEGIAAAKNWGSDMMSNFVEGVKSKISALKAAVSSVASTVQGVLGHSHPKEGPMADDYKWMPDMMQLFAQGISDNAHLVTDQLERVFDFQNMINAPEVAFGVSGSYNSSSAVNPMNEVISLLTQIRDKGNIVVLEGDAAQMFRVMQREAKRNTQLTGEAFA
jgi:phage-related protein